MSSPLTPGELRTLEQVCDALLPANDTPWRASAAQRVADLIGRIPNRDDVLQLRLLLTLLERPPALFSLSGRWARFSELNRAQREGVLRALAAHPVLSIRGGFQALKRLGLLAYFAATDQSGRNPAWAEMGYPGPPFTPVASPRPLQPLVIEGDTTLSCDVVVVGSGAGGGMVADELSAAGHDVIVLEAGGYWDRPDFDGRELDGLRRLYLGSGLLTSDDAGVVCLAGSCLGGGTVVNYTTSFRTPDDVREEWARLSGFSFFRDDGFTRSLAAACDRLGVNRDHNLPSRRDEIMAKGLKGCGWHVDAMPRNVRGCTQDEVCGFCGYGCSRGAKQSTLQTCLAAAYERGARLVVDCPVHRVIVERGQAVGVMARTKDGHELTVRSRAVVVAAGAISSPALLLRSGLDGAVGKNLFLHPATAVWGRFDEEVRPWTGTLQALYSDELADLDGGYGVRFETAPMHPALLSLGLPWSSGKQFAELARGLPYTSFVGLLLRDRDGGSVTVNRDGSPVIRYRISRYDQNHVRQAVEIAARVLLGAGAREILSTQARPVTLRRGQDNLRHWLRQVERAGYGPNRTIYVSFHQMGTCRLGSDPDTSVVGDTGETHAVRRLFVADGSLFPTASGVNPMISIVALAHWVAQRIKEKL